MRSIRWKLVLTTLITVFIPLYFLNHHFIRDFDLFTRTELEKHMREGAQFVGGLYLHLLREAPPGGNAQARLNELLVEYAPHAKSRIRVLDPGGVVFLDTDPAATVGEDLSTRPEVMSAMHGRYDARSRLTSDRQFMYYDCAEPALRNQQVLGIVYVSRHTNPIIKAILRMRTNQRFSTAMALALAGAVAVLFAHTLTHRLRRLSRAASAYARGESATRVSGNGRDEIAELARSFNHMADEIERRENYNRIFVSETLHELKAPLTAIRGAAEVLEEGADEKPAARRKFIAHIRRQADRMTRLVSELNELTRLDMETLRGNKQELDYVQTVRGIVERLQPGSDEDPARLHCVLPDRPIYTWIMPGRIEQVLANLIDNAFRYTPHDGSIEVRVDAESDGTVTTWVADTGCGISEANLPKVFERFFTTEPKNAGRDYGSGLGLAIAKSIIENHQGAIRVTSVKGQGARFSFTLPVTRR